MSCVNDVVLKIYTENIIDGTCDNEDVLKKIGNKKDTFI